MANISEQPEFQFLDAPHAPDVFADGFTGFAVFNENLRITLECVRVNHATSPGPVTRVVIGRIVMPLPAAEVMARELLAFIESRKAQQNPPAQAAPTVKH